MPFKLLKRAGLEGRLKGRHFRVGSDDVAAFFQFDGSFQRIDLDLATDAFCTLAPLEFNGIEVML